MPFALGGHEKRSRACDVTGAVRRKTLTMSNESLNAGLTLEQVCVDCADPAALSSWWQSLIGGERTVDDDGDVHLDRGLIPLLFIRVPEPKALKNRLHIDLRAENFDQAVEHALAIAGPPRPMTSTSASAGGC